jgi:hypothetical protein
VILGSSIAPDRRYSAAGVPVRRDHFYFVAWYTPYYSQEPALRAFEFASDSG